MAIVFDNGGFIGDALCRSCGKRFGQHYGLDCDQRDPSRTFVPMPEPEDIMKRPQPSQTRSEQDER